MCALVTGESAPAAPSLAPGTVVAADSVRADSTTIEQTLRAAQKTFEWNRRRRLPTTRSEHDGCPERVGRFCVWFDDDDVPPRPEPPAIGELRLRLVARLDSGFERLRGSRWISGQLVRYLIEAGRPDSALSAARACRADEAWCAGLTGLALHALGREAAAVTAFRRREAAMPTPERCRSTDLSHLLRGEVASHYARLPCPSPAREVFERRFWWLADPLYLVPGNDRLAEDRARRLTSRIAEDADSPYDVRWGPDLAELTLRYGWPTWWERARRDPLLPGPDAGMAAHFVPHARYLVSLVDPLTPPRELAPSDWKIDARRAKSSYAPAYIDTLLPLPSRLAVFRRGDSAVVVAAYTLPRTDSAGAGGRGLARASRKASVPPPAASTGPSDGSASNVAALLYLSGGPEETPSRDLHESAPREGVLAVRVPARGLLVSVEALDRTRRVAGRARRGLDLRPPPEGVPAISDLLAGPPLEPNRRRARTPGSRRLASGPADPVAAAADLRLAGPGPAAAPASRPGTRLELYWELYGLPPGRAPFRVSVTLRPARASWFEPGGAPPRVSDTHGPAADLEWTEERGPFAPAYPGRVALALPASLREGLYEVEVKVSVPGWTPLVSRAPVLVEGWRVSRDME